MVSKPGMRYDVTGQEQPFPPRLSRLVAQLLAGAGVGRKEGTQAMEQTSPGGHHAGIIGERAFCHPLLQVGSLRIDFAHLHLTRVQRLQEVRRADGLPNGFAISSSPTMRIPSTQRAN